MNDTTCTPRSGMTYIEVLFVVIILAMLASMALPSWLKPREEARRAICIQNLRALSHGKTIWAISEGKGNSDTPSQADLQRYVQQNLNRVVCPVDENKSFSTSYSIGTVGSPVECLIVPDSHVYTEDED